MFYKSPNGSSAIGAFFYAILYGLLLCSSTITGSVKAAPFLTTDQNPFSLTRGLPLPVAAALPISGSSSYYTALEITNTINSESTLQENILLDFEAYHYKIGFSTGFSEDWAFNVNLPFIHRGGGNFDKAIDNWHDFFGLPRAERPSLVNNKYHIRYIKNGITLIDLTQADSQVGDIQLTTGRRLTSRASITSSIWLTLDLPTGDVANLTGSEKVDLSIYLATDSKLNNQWNVFSNLGLLFSGESSNSSLETTSHSWFGHLGLSWSIIPKLDLQIQINGHTRLYKNSDLKLLGGTYEFIFGGELHVSQCSLIAVAVSEDIKVGAAPDISLLINWRSKIGKC